MPSQGPGRPPKFTYAKDLISLREVDAYQAHIAPNGAKLKLFETAESKANATLKLNKKVNWKSMQDRYVRL